MNQMNLIIDYRENKLIEQLTLKQINYTTENLDIGDIMIKMDGNPYIIIERKSISDLKSSICDGRLREQRCRLLQASGLSPTKIIYIIEGLFNESNKRLLKNTTKQIDTSTLIGSIINMMFRDNIKVHRTISIEETADFIIKLFDKVNDKEIFKVENQEQKVENQEEQKVENQISYTSTLNKKKKNNMTPQVWFICQLSMIPQLSDTIALAITKEYPTLSSLFLKYESIEEEKRPDLLTNITYDLKTGKKRKVGKIISLRVYEYFYSK